MCSLRSLFPLTHSLRIERVRCIIVTGSKGRCFCAGADLSRRGNTFNASEKYEIDGRIGVSKGGQVVCVDTQTNDKYIQPDHRDSAGQVVLAIRRCRKPTIAAINGHAVGVGITFTLPMDMRVVGEDSKIGT